jgi:hypothetical protein
LQGGSLIMLEKDGKELEAKFTAEVLMFLRNQHL